MSFYKIIKLIMKKVKTETKSQVIKKLDRVFSKYIRLKYSDKNWICECISCWKKIHWKEAHNCHWISRWNLQFRFDEENCRPGCPACNTYRPEFHIREFTIKQIERLWKEKVDEMRRQAKEVYKIWIVELREKLEYYKQKVKQLEKEKGLSIK